MPTAEKTAADWMREGHRVVIATLVERIGSAPLDPGAQMLIDESGRIEGSVTGGCVEAALVEEAQKVFAGGPPQLLEYGISDEEAAGVGLMCGGAVRVFVHAPDARLARAAGAGRGGDRGRHPGRRRDPARRRGRRGEDGDPPRRGGRQPRRPASCSTARSAARRGASSTRAFRPCGATAAAAK